MLKFVFGWALTVKEQVRSHRENLTYLLLLTYDLPSSAAKLKCSQIYVVGENKNKHHSN